ncbi:hypothetical protein BBJ28_00022684 [Nothophytophthora sp. Chile5]|nr:hypothetical protein BBJ28_00022684 [Nothophytophthora sp. Chile5]
MAELQQQLTELFVARRQHGEPGAQQDALAATRWADCIHCAFYGVSAAARGSNKFLELEATLTQVFTSLGRLAGSTFWEFVVHVVLQLAQEPRQQVLAVDSIAAPVAVALVGAKGQPKKKTKKKLSQPNAPLSFVVINALRNVTEEGDRELQRSHCHFQGRTNAQLRAFCLRGLQDAHLVVCDYDVLVCCCDGCCLTFGDTMVGALWVLQDQKLVVELLDLFAIKDIEPETVRNAAQSLLAAKKYTALIKLFTAFSSFDWSFEETIKAIVKAKDWSAAELLARTLSGPGERGTLPVTEEAIRRAMNHFFGEESEYNKPAAMADDGGMNQANAFAENQIVGLDVEWKPTMADADELPSWRETATYVHDLVYSSPLSGEEASDAIALREKYRQHWLENINARVATSVEEAAAVNLLTTRDIEEYWEARKRLHQQEQLGRSVGAGDGVEEALDTELALVRAQTVKELLQQPLDPTQPVVFVVVNSICFFADGMCASSTCKLDTARLATLCGVGRRRIKLATPVECCEHFGFAPGTVPPFGHRSMVGGAEASGWEAPRVRIYASESLQHAKYLACGGGSPETLLWLNSRAFFALIDLEAVGDIQRGMSAVHFSDSTQKPFTSSTAAAPASPEQQLGLTLEYKFLADSMVARVGKWLRTIGMDVIVWDPYAASKEGAGPDQKAALLALAVREQRIVLTRDKKLASRRDAGACFVVSSDDPFQQFQEIKTHFALRLVKEEMMSRCSRCNAKGFDVVDLDYVRTQTADEVHPNVLEVVTEFWVCRVCHKIYWEGPKYDSNYANLLRMFDDHSIVESQHPSPAAAGEE